MSVKIHIAVALVAATGAVLILSLLVIAQSAHGSAEGPPFHRQGITFPRVNPDILEMILPTTMWVWR